MSTTTRTYAEWNSNEMGSGWFVSKRYKDRLIKMNYLGYTKKEALMKFAEHRKERMKAIDMGAEE